MSDAVRDASPPKQWVSVCAALVAGLAFAALLGWATGIRVLASFGSDLVPMAPSTAVMFLLYALAVFLQVRSLSRHMTARAGLIITSAGALAALVLLVLSLFGVYFDVEHPGFRIHDRPGDTPIGHMSPLTAFCFLLASASFLPSYWASLKQPRRTILAWWLACPLTGISLVLLLVYMFGTQVLHGGEFLPPAATTSLAFLLLGTALLGLAKRPELPVQKVVEPTARTSRALILVFCLLAAGIVTAGLLYSRQTEKHYRAEVEHQLSAIAELKVDQLVQWRKERLGDASVFYRNTNFTELVRRFHENPDDTDAQSRMRTWLAKVQAAYHYDRLCLQDTAGVERISIPESPHTHASNYAGHASEAMRSGHPTLTDFNRNEHNQRVYLRLLIPIVDGQNGRRPLGVLVLRIDPQTYLYPLISRWPTPSNTAETLIVRREGDELVFLNELRFQTDSALNLRIPLADPNLPAAMAVNGREGIVEGIDYRGVPVVACVRSIPDSPWFLVARMDRSEVYAPLRRRMWALTFGVVSSLITAGAITGLLWRRQSIAFLRERYQAAEVLLRHEERYRRTLDGMMEGCQIIGRDWRYLYLNDAAARHGRREKEELVGRPLVECYPGIETTEMFGSLQRCMDERRPHHMENEFAYPDDSRKWFELSMLPVPEGVFILSIDITERKRAEEALRQSTERERFLADIIEKAQQPLSVGYPDGRMGICNRAFTELTGYGAEELQTTDWLKVLTPPEWLPIEMEALAELERTGKPVRYEKEYLRKDGTRVPIELLVHAARDEAGTTQYYYSFVTDISERKQAREKLRHLNAVLHAVRNVNQLITKEKDRDVLLSRTCEVLTETRGYRSAWIGLVDGSGSVRAAAESGIGAGFAAIHARIESGERPDCMREALNQPGVVVMHNTEANCIHCSLAHTYRDTAALARRVDHAGRDYGTLVVALPAVLANDEEEQSLFEELCGDIGFALHAIEMEQQRRAAEAEIRRLNDELEQRVRERTARWEAANKELEAFSYAVSHDLRAPLRRMDGFSQALLKDYADRLDEQGRHYLARIRAGAQQMGELIDALLTLSRITRSEMKLDCVDLSKMARRIAEELGRSQPDREVDFVIQQGITTEGDPSLLRTVMENLLSNAWKYTGRMEGKARIEFGAARNSECGAPGKDIANNTIVCFVRDNGAGFDMAFVDKLFTAFQRLHRVDEFEGTGIGLATVQRIVHRHGGRVWAEGAPNKGATFYFALGTPFTKGDGDGGGR